MQQVLGSFQLADPEEFVLPLLAAAVLNGSSWFRLDQKGATTRLSWSEPALEPEQLQKILPSLGHSGTLLSELGIALLAARRLGRVSFQSGQGRVSFDRDQLVVDDHDGQLPNCLTLIRPWWHRALGRPRMTAYLLKNRARFAPLQLTPRRAPHNLRAELAWKTSALEVDWFSAHDWVDLPPNPWGDGILYFGQADWQLIRHGVTHNFPTPIPGVTAIWWSDQLPLDLSRKEVIRGDEFKNWTAWIHDQLSETILTRGLRQHFAALVGSSRPSQLPALLDAPIFRRSDGSIACLGQLREEYLQHGWLPVVSYQMQIEWEPQRVVIVDHPHERQLCNIFSNWINLDHLQGQINLPRLPNPEDYLVRVPFMKGRGEAGLRRFPRFYGTRWFEEGAWREERGIPFGLDVAREDKQGQLPMGELYWTMKIMTLSDTWEHLRHQHLLQMFAWLKAALLKKLQKRFARQHPLEVLLDPKSQVQLSHCRGVIRAAQFQGIAENLRFRLHSGEQRALSQLAPSIRYFSAGCWNGPSDSLRLTLFETAALQLLFLPDTFEEKSTNPSTVWATETAMALLSEVQSGDQLLSRFLAYGECAAHKILRAAGVSALPSGKATLDVAEIVRRAIWEVHSQERGLNTAYLLLALAQDPALGLDRDLLLPWLLEWGEWENQHHLAALCQAIEATPDAGPEFSEDYQQARAWSHLHVRQYEQTRQLCRTQLSRASSQASASILLGLADSLEGDLEAGLVHFRQAFAQKPEPMYATSIAEALMWLGRREEARQSLPDSGDPYTLMIRASLADTPEEQLRLCDLTEQAGRDQYFELAELRGQAYFELGQYDRAREHLTRFLEARLDNSLLDLHEERQQRAREMLRKCEQS